MDKKLTGCMSCMEAALFQPPKNSVLIAIRDPYQEHPNYTGKWEDIIRLNFWDVDREIAGYSPATQEQCFDIWLFINKYKDKNIFAHCEAGISRSGAVREFLDRQGWEVMFSRQIHPNQHVLSWLNFFEREKQ